MSGDIQLICPECGGFMKRFDHVRRIVKRKGGKIERIKVQRYLCEYCGALRRDLPEYVLPYKQYERDIIAGVIEGFITPSTLGFEDRPCEATMKRWLEQYKRVSM